MGQNRRFGQALSQAAISCPFSVTVLSFRKISGKVVDGSTVWLSNKYNRTQWE